MKYEEYNIGEGTLNFTVVEPNGFNPHNHYPIVVLMHGFGASSKDLAPLASAINARGYIYAFPQAPIEMRMGFGGIGYAWAPISGDGIEESINNSKSLINRFLDELLKLYGDEETKVVLVDNKIPSSSPQGFIEGFKSGWRGDKDGNLR